MLLQNGIRQVGPPRHFIQGRRHPQYERAGCAGGCLHIDQA